MIQINDKVRVISKEETIKEGIVVGVTSHGANVFGTKLQKPFVDVAQFAEWFPFKAKDMRIAKIEGIRKLS